MAIINSFGCQVHAFGRLAALDGWRHPDGRAAQPPSQWHLHEPPAISLLAHESVSTLPAASSLLSEGGSLTRSLLALQKNARRRKPGGAANLDASGRSRERGMERERHYAESRNHSDSTGLSGQLSFEDLLSLTQVPQVDLVRLDTRTSIQGDAVDVITKWTSSKRPLKICQLLIHFAGKRTNGGTIDAALFALEGTAMVLAECHTKLAEGEGYDTHCLLFSLRFCRKA
eukprot:TRINITY_DN24221_c0_g1_i1.p1 TRINITY_DN24221_c0_g1~~TRINITY_DN24221_c0_g1_i1.p1  ORF type:complete len:259 (+),score=15.12 TRINITY_DN24221_c0_g1_i1:93-779(+)